ncbi:TPR-like protein, partial [Athelia psychrophila]
DDLPAPSSSLSVLPPSQPLPPDIWFGRGDIVSSLAAIITGNKNPRIAILGAGGMGKTSAALHVIHHEAVVARYGVRVFFVACDTATSTQLLAFRILQIIGVSAGPGENLVTAMHLALKCTPPTLLLLDNFESVWETEKDHTATRDLLQKIADSPSSTLIITMRANIPPPGIRWTFSEALPPLPASSSKEVFLAINATFCDSSDDGDQVLDQLLSELDYVPLAIHLLAHVSTNLSPRFVQRQWQKRRTRLLNVSISLSMESLNLNRNPAAIQLLGMICLLPDGLLRWQERLDVIEETFETATSDLFLLRQLALVYTTEANLGVLSPIRHFVLQHYPPDSQHVQCIYNIIWELVYTHATADFGPKFLGAVEALSPEMGNIGNLVDHAVASNPGETIVDIATQISWHLYRTHPSHHILQKVHNLVPSVTTLMRARYFQVSGNILYLQSECAVATSVFTQARDLFLETGDRLGAGQCSRRLGDLLVMQSNYSEAATIFTDTRAQFIEIGDRVGAAQCSRSLGHILFMQSNYPEATAILTNTRAQFIEIGNHLGATQCSQSMGDILIMQRKYSEATAILTEARAKFIEIGERSGTAQCSLSLGNILRSQGKYSEATAIVTDSRAQFIEIGDRVGHAECLASLGAILIDQRNYTEANSLLLRARDIFIDIDRAAWVAHCSELLGHCVCARGREDLPIDLENRRVSMRETPAVAVILVQRSGRRRG